MGVGSRHELNMYRFLIIALQVLWLPSVVLAQSHHCQTDIEELFYAIGKVQTAGFKEYLENNYGVGLACKSNFIKGVHEGAAEKSESQRAYYAGLKIGEQVIVQMMNGICTEVFGGKSLIIELKERFMIKFANGFTDALDKRAKYSLSEAHALANSKIKKFKIILKNNQALTPSSRQEADDMFYAIGIAQTDGMDTYLENTTNINRVYISDFIRGVKKVAYGEQSKERHAYYAGLGIGEGIAMQMLNGIERDVFNELSVGEERVNRLRCFLEGFTDGINNTGRYTLEKARDIASTIMEMIKKDINNY